MTRLPAIDPLPALWNKAALVKARFARFIHSGKFHGRRDLHAGTGYGIRGTWLRQSRGAWRRTRDYRASADIVHGSHADRACIAWLARSGVRVLGGDAIGGARGRHQLFLDRCAHNYVGFALGDRAPRLPRLELSLRAVDCA